MLRKRIWDGCLIEESTFLKEVFKRGLKNAVKRGII